MKDQATIKWLEKQISKAAGELKLAESMRMNDDDDWKINRIRRSVDKLASMLESVKRTGVVNLHASKTP